MNPKSCSSFSFFRSKWNKNKIKYRFGGSFSAIRKFSLDFASSSTYTCMCAQLVTIQVTNHQHNYFHKFSVIIMNFFFQFPVPCFTLLPKSPIAVSFPLYRGKSSFVVQMGPQTTNNIIMTRTKECSCKWDAHFIFRRWITCHFCRKFFQKDLMILSTSSSLKIQDK